MDALQRKAVQELTEKLVQQGVFEIIEMHIDRDVIIAQDFVSWAQMTFENYDAEEIAEMGFTLAELDAARTLAPHIVACQTNLVW